MSLRKAVIKLAYHQPQLRDDLLPVVLSPRQKLALGQVMSIRNERQGALVLDTLAYMIAKEITPSVAQAVEKTFKVYSPSSIGRSYVTEFKDFLATAGNKNIKVHAGFDPQIIQSVSDVILRQILRMFLKLRPPKASAHAGDVRTIKQWWYYLYSGGQEGLWNWTEKNVTAALHREFTEWLEREAPRRYEGFVDDVLDKKSNQIASQILNIMEQGVKENKDKIEASWVKQFGKTGGLLQRIKSWFGGGKALNEKNLMDTVTKTIEANAPEIKRIVGESVVAEDVNTVLNSFKAVSQSKLASVIESVMVPLVSGAVDPYVPADLSEIRA